MMRDFFIVRRKLTILCADWLSRSLLCSFGNSEYNNIFQNFINDKVLVNEAEEDTLCPTSLSVATANKSYFSSGCSIKYTNNHQNISLRVWVHTTQFFAIWAHSAE